MIDLRAIAAERGFKFMMDESGELDTGKTERPWLWQIPGRHGHVWVSGESDLGVYCTSNRLVRRLLEIPGVSKSSW